MKSEEIFFRGRPAGAEEAGWSSRGERAIFFEIAGGEEVELLAGAGAGDVEEALFFGAGAGFFDAVQPLVEQRGIFSLALDGSEEDRRRVFGCAGSIEFEPVQKIGRVTRDGAMQAGDEDDIPFKSFGLVNGEQIDGGRAGGGFGEELLEARV